MSYKPEYNIQYVCFINEKKSIVMQLYLNVHLIMELKDFILRLCKTSGIEHSALRSYVSKHQDPPHSLLWKSCAWLTLS